MALQHVHPQVQVHDRMLENAHAQMVVQNMHLNKLQLALKGKETKATKKTDRSKLFPQGKGCHMTDLAFVTALEEEKELQMEAEAMRIQCKANHMDSKAEKKALEAQWMVMKTAHEAAVELWETHCD